jgi:hypothetical protein
MTLKTLQVRLNRRNGRFIWRLFEPCPYCGKRHRLDGGNYTQDPEVFLGGRTLPCGAVVSIFDPPF